MKYFFRTIVSNMYKVVHTKILWLHLLIPLVGIGLAGGYIVQSAWTETEKIISYVQLVAIVFPFMATVAVTMLFETDLKAGRFQNVLFIPCSKMLSHFGNLLPLFFLGGMASVLTTVGFHVFLNVAGVLGMPFLVFVVTGVYLFMFHIVVYFLQYMICFTWGKSISLGVGITGTLLSAMLMMGIGDSIWKWCPYSYGVRCISYFLFRILKPEEYVYIREENETGLCVVMLVTAVMLVLFLIWGSLWQGTKEKEQ